MGTLLEELKLTHFGCEISFEIQLHWWRETSPWLEKLHKYSNIWHGRPKQSSVFSLAYPVAFSRGRYNWTLDVYGKWHLRITVLMWAICMFCSSCLLVMCVMSFALGIWTGTRWTLWPCNMNQGGFYIFIFSLKGIVHPNIKNLFLFTHTHFGLNP